MSRTFFTADHHFGHKNIIKHCKRPFKTVQEMDEFMVAIWNEKVEPNDIVFHLGDFAFGRSSYIFNQLNGRKYLIAGNHDSSTIKGLGWIRVFEYYEYIQFQKMILFHYAIDDWNHKRQGSIMLHGHSHGRCPIIENRFDVGVDCFSFAPVTLDEILATQEAQT